MKTTPHAGLPTGVLHTTMALLACLSFEGRAEVKGGSGFVASTLTPPKLAREFRGAWVATVGNIDWPSRKGLSTAEQKAELIAIMDQAARLKLNALIFQVRPGCDAFYDSRIEPWSEYLTGTMGKAPKPFYDPLAFAISEAHRRGLELHAWFNPYRARHQNAQSPVAASHISRTRPGLVREYGKYLWLDPGEPDVRDHSLKVVMDVVRRYDVDGIHFDDYFYPYKEKDRQGNELDFPDDVSWRRFGAKGMLGREDWRRENVNAFIRRVYEAIKAAKPWVKFGVSPFGIWRPNQPGQVKGLDAYEKLYADSRLWLREGWLDYCAPQLYWPIEPKEQSFPILLQWWVEQNVKQRALWPGLNTTKAGRAWPVAEIVDQIRLTRAHTEAPGHIHWNMKSLMQNRDQLADTLEKRIYQQPALIPAMSWLSDHSPAKPTLSVTSEKENARVKISWRITGRQSLAVCVLQWRTKQGWRTEILPATNSTYIIAAESWPEAVALTAVDRFGNTGPPEVLESRTR